VFSSEFKDEAVGSLNCEHAVDDLVLKECGISSRS